MLSWRDYGSFNALARDNHMYGPSAREMDAGITTLKKFLGYNGGIAEEVEAACAECGAPLPEYMEECSSCLSAKEETGVLVLKKFLGLDMPMDVVENEMEEE